MRKNLRCKQVNKWGVLGIRQNLVTTSSLAYIINSRRSADIKSYKKFSWCVYPGI